MKVDLSKIKLTEPIMPYINEDGYYPQCYRCWTELDDEQKVCHKCNQVQDWSWLGKYKKIREN